MTYKVCNSCRVLKPTRDFYTYKKPSGNVAPRSMCKTCFKDKTSSRKKGLISWLRSYKRMLSCEKCGYSKKTDKNFTVKALHFHHKEGKLFDISVAVYKRGMSIDKIENEISKCVVLCSRCHAEAHA